ncbi:Phosphatidylserine lipase ABHD16A, partial [Gonioctena quinquepunctata]
EFLRKYSVDENLCNSLLQSYVSEYSKNYPMKIGETFNTQEKFRMALFLAKSYMRDVKATHCVNLPSEMFQTPWDVNVESDYVFT